MDKKEFNALVARPETFSSQDRGWLRAKQSKYSRSAVVGLLALLADHAYGYDTPKDHRMATLSVCNASVVDTRLASARQTTHTVASEPTEDILNEINTFQEVSFKTAPKSVILSNFLQASPSEESEMARQHPLENKADEKKSLIPDASLGTETLAVILEQQGKFDRALAIYKNLLVHNPEKSSIFAPRIERLETLLKSK